MVSWLDRLRSGHRRLSSRRVAAYYDEWHERYLAAFGDTFQSARTDDLAALFAHIAAAAELRPGQRVLDAGCGVGGPALWFARECGVEVVALNISRRQVEEARRRVDAAGLGGRVEVVEGDFHFLAESFPAQRFDAVLFLESLVHSDHPRRVLDGVARVLEPGGVLYVKDLFRRAWVGWGERRRVARVLRNVDRACCLNVKPQRPFLRAVAAAGLDLEWLRELPIPVNHDLGNAFVAASGLDLYGGEPITFLDWLELKARRPQGTTS